MWSQIPATTWVSFTCWEMFSVVLGWKVFRGNTEIPQWVKLRGCAAATTTTTRVKTLSLYNENTLQLFVSSQMSCWLSKKPIFPAKIVALQHEIHSQSAALINTRCFLRRRRAFCGCHLGLFFFSHHFVFSHALLPKHQKLDLYSVLPHRESTTVWNSSLLVCSSKRDGNISVWRLCRSSCATNKEP